ncbi:hypothetical protein [Maribacter sp. 2307ULW6-5]|uniref:hypothetical protein n=1 Tax=Maribacter sp. 2307ULW6-5 TaxID=3386275 RepID=UPI0039BD60CF
MQWKYFNGLRLVFLILIHQVNGQSVEIASNSQIVVSLPGNIFSNEALADHTPYLYLGKPKMHRPEKTAILTDVTLEGNSLKIEPKFSLFDNTEYYILFPEAWNQRPYDFRIEREVSKKNPPVVLNILPTTNQVPENLLRFYIVFSQSMQEGFVASHVKLYENDSEVKHTFVPLKDDLWNKDRTIVTLILDPSRVKTNVGANVLLGRALKKGKHYKLVIASGWEGPDGNVTEETVTKTITVLPQVSEKLDTSTLTLNVPTKTTKEAITVQWHPLVDILLCQEMVRIVTDEGEVVKGRIAIDIKRNQWSFTPLLPWKRGSYQLLIEKTLEDHLGNNFKHPFDTKAASRIAEKQGDSVLSVVWRPKID